MKILITGGCGFIGHHFVEHLIKNTDWEVAVLDRLTYASNGYDRLRDINCFDNKRVKVFSADLEQLLTSDGLRQEIGEVDLVSHLAAETHVDNSITAPYRFLKTNIIGTYYVLEYIKRYNEKVKWVNMFSTDEVMGSAPDGVKFTEKDTYNCKNPYSASKAGAEQLCVAYENCYKIPIFITRTMNNYGERQHPEKFIPMVIKKVLSGEVVTVHSDSTKTISGSRFYIHARNVSDALLFLFERAESADIYNIVGEKEVSNLNLARMIADVIGEPLRYEMVDFHRSRPGHDLRYALDGTKVKNMGWEPPKSFEHSLEKTIKWYLENPKWLQ